MNKKAFLSKAKQQFKSASIPTITAVAASVVISKMGVPLIAICGVCAAGYAYWRGYRLKLTKPTAQESEQDES